MGKIFLITDKRSVSVWFAFSVTVINHSDKKQAGRGKSLHGLQFQVSVHLWGKSKQELKEELKQNPEEPFTGSFTGFCSASSYIPQNSQPRDCATHSGLGLPTSISCQENVP